MLFQETRARAYTVVNCHLNALGPSEYRERQATELVDAFGDTQCLVVCGDMNDGEESAAVQKLRDAGWADSMQGVEDRCTWTSNNPMSQGWMRVDDVCVDYVFHSADLKFRGGMCFNKPPFIVSDHMGVRAVLVHSPQV